MARRCWTQAEDEFIRANWNTMRSGEIAQALGRPRPSLSRRARRLGLSPQVRKWTAGEDDVLRRLYRVLPQKCVAKRLGRTAPQCSERAGRLGLRLTERGGRAARTEF